LTVAELAAILREEWRKTSPTLDFSRSRQDWCAAIVNRNPCASVKTVLLEKSIDRKMRL
jgi:hypothetical protein